MRQVVPSRFSETPSLGRRQRLALLALALAVQALIGWAVVRGLSGVSAVLREAGLAPVIEAHDVPIAPHTPTPTPSPARTTPAREAEGAQGAAGRKARATQIVAAPARVPVRTIAAAPAASTGNDTRSGASVAGEGTGGSAAGNGTGSGGSGNGAGGRYVAQKAVKIAGDITSARDYPKATRAQRLGTSVVVVLGIGTDGRVTGCRIHKASGDAQADAITCRLATERFRFRPALDQTGAPVESTYGWEQRFFAP